MSASQLFSVSNGIARLAWIALVALPEHRVARALTGRVAPLALAGLYCALVAARLGRASGGFDTLAHVQQLFADPWLLLAGRVHYLAFDLFVGRWEATDAAERRLSRWLLRPCHVLTFLLGPAGLLTYMLVRQLAPAPQGMTKL